MQKIKLIDPAVFNKKLSKIGRNLPLLIFASCEKINLSREKQNLLMCFFRWNTCIYLDISRLVIGYYMFVQKIKVCTCVFTL